MVRDQRSRQVGGGCSNPLAELGRLVDVQHQDADLRARCTPQTRRIDPIPRRRTDGPSWLPGATSCHPISGWVRVRDCRGQRHRVICKPLGIEVRKVGVGHDPGPGLADVPPMSMSPSGPSGRSIRSWMLVAPGDVVVLWAFPRIGPAVLNPIRLSRALYQRVKSGQAGLGPGRVVDEDADLARVPASDATRTW